MKTWRTLRNHPELWKRYFVRETVLRTIRHFFGSQNFHEVETPLLTGSLPPESYLEIFETTLLSRTRQKTHAYLPTSPEPFLKKLLVAGIGNCFTLTKSFRNTEDMSETHVPEFTILEWYRLGADYTAIMDDVEALVCSLAGVIYPKQAITEFPFQGHSVDLSRPWVRMSVCEAFQAYAGIDLIHTLTKETMYAAGIAKGYRFGPDDTWEVMFHQLFLNEIEPHLGKGKPVFLYDYPVELAALSRKKPSDPRFAERFEFYIDGLELGDAYSELTDWKEQQTRFNDEDRRRKEEGKIEHPIDTDFIAALKVGLPTCAGIAVGVDRLVMLLADTIHITDTLFFPPRDLFDSKASE